MSDHTTTTDDDPKPAAFRFGSTRDWPSYFEAVKGKGPRETILFALDRFAEEGVPDADQIKPLAVDLGCGEGRDTAELLNRNWRVVGIDGTESAFETLARRPGILDNPSFEPRLSPFEECTIPRCTLLNASFSLPFCEPQSFDALWRIIRFAIEPGGRFAGQLFGDRDTWGKLPDRSHHTRLQAEKLLLGMDIEMFTENEKDAADSEGNAKHWHVFHIVARQPQD